MKVNQKSRGIGLLELMLSLAIIAILLVMATRYFGQARQGQQVAAAIEQITSITAAYQNYSMANPGTAPTLAALQAAGYLPASASTNPWNGSVTLGAAKGGSAPSGTLNITFAGVPTNACNQLANQTASLSPTGAQAPACAGGSFSGDFGPT